MTIMVIIVIGTRLTQLFPERLQVRLASLAGQPRRLSHMSRGDPFVRLPLRGKRQRQQRLLLDLMRLSAACGWAGAGAALY